MSCGCVRECAGVTALACDNVCTCVCVIGVCAGVRVWWAFVGDLPLNIKVCSAHFLAASPTTL